MDGDVSVNGDVSPNMKIFTILKTAGRARLGTVVWSSTKAIETPHYLGNTSRGVVPHITQDTFERDANINSVYVALEDFIERAPKDVPPIYKFQPRDGEPPLRRFIALPNETLLVLGARRTPPVAAPPANSNTDKSVSICTAVGFRQLDPENYIEAVEKLGADIVLSLGDIPYERALGSKRVERATDRSIQWLENHVTAQRNARSDSAGFTSRLFASLLPVPCARQQFYVDTIADQLRDDIAGLALFAVDTLEDLSETLTHLPRLGFLDPKSPLEVLQHISLGLDLVTIPFITSATDAGIALDFTFPSPAADREALHDRASPLPLGIDMWSSSHAIDLSPIGRGCQCHTCITHHRAYIQHLLAAKEMLGWILIQIHNHHVLDLFFAAIRHSISAGTFEEDTATFTRTYERDLPQKTGQGPRVRGYQYKSEGPGETKKNPVTFAVLNDRKERLAEAAPPDEKDAASDLQAKGFAEEQDA